MTIQHECINYRRERTITIGNINLPDKEPEELTIFLNIILKYFILSWKLSMRVDRSFPDRPCSCQQSGKFVFRIFVFLVMRRREMKFPVMRDLRASLSPTWWQSAAWAWFMATFLHHFVSAGVWQSRLEITSLLVFAIKYPIRRS